MTTLAVITCIVLSALFIFSRPERSGLASDQVAIAVQPLPSAKMRYHVVWYNKTSMDPSDMTVDDPRVIGWWVCAVNKRQVEVVVEVVDNPDDVNASYYEAKEVIKTNWPNWNPGWIVDYWERPADWVPPLEEYYPRDSHWSHSDLARKFGHGDTALRGF